MRLRTVRTVPLCEVWWNEGCIWQGNTIATFNKGSREVERVYDLSNKVWNAIHDTQESLEPLNLDIMRKVRTWSDLDISFASWVSET